VRFGLIPEGDTGIIIPAGHLTVVPSLVLDFDFEAEDVFLNPVEVRCALSSSRQGAKRTDGKPERRTDGACGVQGNIMDVRSVAHALLWCDSTRI